MDANIESGFFLDKIPYVKHWTEKSKKTLVFLPGAINLFYWTKNPVSNARNNRLFVPEEYTLYILGYDKNLSSDHTMDQMIDEYATILKDIDGPVTILAISFGGNIAIPLAARYPELVDKLILLTTAYTFSKTGEIYSQDLIQLAEKGKIKPVLNRALDLFNNLFYKFLMRRFLKKEQPEIYTDHYPLSTLKYGIKLILDPKNERKKYLSQIQAPTLVIGGTKDKAFSEEIYQETAELIPNAKLKIFDGGHMITVSKAKEVQNVIFKFLLT